MLAPQDRQAIERALRLLGERLTYMDAPATGLLIGGGAALNILGLVTRTTRDVDVIALVQGRSRWRRGTPRKGRSLAGAPTRSSGTRRTRPGPASGLAESRPDIVA